MAVLDAELPPTPPACPWHPAAAPKLYWESICALPDLKVFSQAPHNIVEALIKTQMTNFKAREGYKHQDALRLPDSPAIWLEGTISAHFK